MDRDHEEGLYFRQMLFDKASRVVIKVGSAIVTNSNGVDHAVVDNLVKEISFLHKSGREVILVTSGAVAAGRHKLGVDPEKPLTIPEKQALAAVGQSVLMHAYDAAFDATGEKIAQVLLTHSDLADRKRYLNVRNTIHSLFDLGVIPVINENDTVSVEELRFGDNDYLGALICNLIEGDMFICLTDVSGLYDGNPSENPDAQPIYTVAKVTAEVEAMAGNVKSLLGTGGMQSKIRAAKLVASGGGSSFIGPGKEKDVLRLLFSGNDIGTFFLPEEHKISSRKQWIANVLKPKGELVLDDGACTALLKNGKSLLPAGIVSMAGHFDVGDSVKCTDQNGKVIAVGLINYNSNDTEKIVGVHSYEIEDILGFKDSDEVIHRDNLVKV